MKTIFRALLMTLFPFVLSAQSENVEQQVGSGFCEAFTTIVESYPTFDPLKGEKVENDFSTYYLSKVELPGFFENRISSGMLNSFSYTGIAAKNIKTRTAALKVFGDLKEQISSCTYGFGSILQHDVKDSKDSAFYTPLITKDEKYEGLVIKVRILFDQFDETFRVVLNVYQL